MGDPRLKSLFVDECSLERIERADHAKASLLLKCTNWLRDQAASAASSGVVAFSVPGRIEILGKHTDYCGGRSLLCAVDRGFVFVARRRQDDIVSVADAHSGDRCQVQLAVGAPRTPGHWSNYPATVAQRLALNFGTGVRGVDIVFSSDLPPAAGLSSSSALIVGTFLALASLNQLQHHEHFTTSIASLEDLAHYCGCLENGSGFRGLEGTSGVGTSGGSQDHTAILCCRPETLSQYGFAPVNHERDVAFPADWRLFVLSSGVVAEKTGNAMERYNAVSRRARHLVQIWNDAIGDVATTLASVVRSSPQAAARLHEIIAARTSSTPDAVALHARLEQFVEESERIIPAATQAIATGDLHAFAQLVARSTAGAVERLHNQVPQTIELVGAALRTGAIATSPFGAGFGGSVWAIGSDAFGTDLKAFQVRPSAGAHAIVR